LSVQVITDNLADLRQVATMRGNLLGAALGGGVNPADIAGDKSGGKEAEPAIRLPPGGVPIPERFKELLGRFDKNGDGKLTDDELETMPPGVRDRIRQAVKDRLDGK
jgi:hypothetical protein